MTQKEFNQLALTEACHSDAMAIIHSIQCLLLLVERHQNHPESHRYLGLISASLNRLEGQLNKSLDS